MKRSISTVLIVLLASLWAGAVVAQEWRGMGRVAGKVTDETGAPLEGVVVKAGRAGSQGGPETKTNKKGEFTIAGINSGQWSLDFDEPGFETEKVAASVLEGSSHPPVIVKMKKTAADPNVGLRAELAKANDLMTQKKFAEARAIYEGILAKVPDAYQVEPYIARTYYEEHQIDPAIDHLRRALAKDPNSVEVKLLLANLLAEKGNGDESRQIMASIDDAKLTDPTVVVNIGIRLLNEKKPDEALTWFDKTVTRFPQYADGYYYRGITELQQGKTDAAKADLTKFVEMAPTAPEAATAKGILETLK
jgi:tetratricopeptide (TPR) repeat protein